MRSLHVGVLGAGGGGSILIEQLAHLGVGQITAVDPDIVKRHNLSRIMGASERDAREKRKKVHVARDHAQRIDPSIHFNAIDGDIGHFHVARRLFDCDYLLLATDPRPHAGRKRDRAELPDPADPDRREGRAPRRG